MGGFARSIDFKAPPVASQGTNVRLQLDGSAE